MDSLRWAVGVLVAWGALLVCGCVVSPQPEPPTVVPELLWIEIVPSNPDDPEGPPDTAIIRGESGAVTPGGALLRVFNFERAEEAREVTVDPDGSFSIALSGLPGDEFRLRAFASNLWSSPVDVVAPRESGPPEPSPTPPSCFRVSTPSQLDFGGVVVGDIAVEVVTIDNGCSEDVSIENVWLRIGATDFPNCDAEYESCLGGDLQFDHCSDPYDLCVIDCDSAYQGCIDGGGEISVCQDELSMCQDDGCMVDLMSCTDAACQTDLLWCQDASFEGPQGFTALHGALPMTVPSGSSRSIVVTFAPLESGPAEDALIIVASPESERRSITLTGNGM